MPGGGVGIALVGRIDGCDFGTSNGSLYTTHSSADIGLNAYVQIQLVLNNCKLSSSTEVSGTMSYGANHFIAYQNHDLTAGDNFVQYPNGRVSQDIATVHSPATTSEKMTPTGAFSYLKLVSGTKLTAVNNTHGATPCVWMQKDGSYNGNAPRLMQAANPAVGVNSDTVLATSVLSSSGSWFQVCGASAAFTDNGVGTWFVDVDGTAGNVYIGDWSVTIN
jgi:hypothetical protein